jgi:FkbM family methyltransferase
MRVSEGWHLPDEDAHWKWGISHYQGDVTLSALRFLPEDRSGMVAVDGGAHIGIMTRRFFRAGFSEIHAFEPNPKNRECLYANVGQLPGVFIHSAALGDKYGSVLMEEVAPENSGASRITGREGGFHVDTIPMDSLNLAPSLIKLDLEGYEEKAFEGMKATVMRYRPVLIIENVSQATREQLASIAYVEADTVRADSILVPREKFCG